LELFRLSLFQLFLRFLNLSLCLPFSPVNMCAS
jgi:hypothetical protein